MKNGKWEMQKWEEDTLYFTSISRDKKVSVCQCIY